MKSLAYRDCLRMQNISVWLCRNSSKFHCIVLYRASFRYLNDLCFLFHFHVCVSAIYDYVMLSRIGASYDGHCSSSCPLLLANKLLSLSLTHTPPATRHNLSGRSSCIACLAVCEWIGRVSYVRIYLCYFCFRWKTVSLVQASMQHLIHHVTVSLQ